MQGHCFRGPMWVVLCLAALVPTLFIPGAHAQEGASINGTVVDATGAAIARAQLSLTNVATHETRQTISSGAGFFNFTGLPPATYSLSISAQSFRRLVMSKLTLSVSQQMTVHPILTVGAAQQTVTVSGAPPTITTSSAAISQTVESRQIMNLPLNGRNALQLMALVPGVVQLGNGGQYGMTQMQFSTPGTRSTDVNFTLDGGTNNNDFYNIASSYPNPDALQEFTVTTRSVSASLGRGSTAVQAATKSGTNQFHGTAFEFVRNTQFDARSFFASTRSVFKRNQFGGTIGGPIIRNKLFFFFGYQETLTRGAPGIARYQTLTAAERGGDFSSISKPIIDPTTGKPFPGNVIPAPRIQPFATKLLTDFVPLGNQEDGSFYAFQPVNSLNGSQLIWNFNYDLGTRNMVSFRYLLDNIPQKVGSSSSFTAAQFSSFPARHQNWSLGYTHTFSPTIINQLHLTYDRDAFGVNNSAEAFPQLRDQGLNIDSSASVTGSGLTPDSVISATGYFNMHPNAPTRDRMGNIELNDSASWIHGIQSIQFGTQIYWNQINEVQNWLTGGDMDFNGQVTGNGAADFLLGEFNSYQQLTPTISQLRQVLPSLFLEDDVRVSPRLTLNLGVRWDPFFGWVSKNNQLSTFIPGQQSKVFPLALPGLVYPGDAHLPKSIVGNRLNNFAPRVGLAWDVHGNGKLAIRASFGTFYIPLTRGISLNRFPLIPPYALSITLNGGNAGALWDVAPFNGVNPYPPPPTNIEALKKQPFTPTSSSTIFQLPFKTPVNQQWSLSVQQALGRDTMFELAYIGSAGSHEFTSYESNSAIYIPGKSTVANIQERRPFNYLGNLQTEANALSSNYNALEITFRKRYANSLMAISTYTWERGLGVVGSVAEGGNGPRNPNDWKMDYGPLSDSYAGNWVTSFIWDIPYGSHLSSRTLRQVAGGWQLNAINTLRSGAPFTISSGHDTALLGIGGETADLVGNPYLANRNRKEFFNTAAFTQPPTGGFGTVGLNTMTGPVHWDTDLGLAKSFSLVENMNLKFRGEFYNVFNHTNFNNPNSTLSSPAFGTITGSGDPRVIELGAHLQF